MSSTSETGHAKNVAAFDELIAFVNGLGAKYNPSKQTITLAKLQILQTNARQVLKELNTAKTAMDNATNTRAEAFELLKQLSTRILAAFSMVSTEAGAKDLKALQRKIYGTRAGGKGKKPPPPVTGGEQQPQPTDGSISVSQRSYDNLASHFDKLIEVVKANPDYKPNEEDLAVEGLKEKLAELQSANTNVATTFTAWQNARIKRSEVLYDPLTGLTTVAKHVKDYVKSVFTSTSPQYKQARHIKLKRLR